MKVYVKYVETVADLPKTVGVELRRGASVSDLYEKIGASSCYHGDDSLNKEDKLVPFRTYHVNRYRK